jgi:pilus assembly protein Flp/PilA
MLSRLLRDDFAGTAAEYGLIASVLAIAIISGIALVGNTATIMFNYIGSQVSNTLQH